MKEVLSVKFEELFEEIMIKAKAVADTAGKMTGDVVEIGKLRYQIKQAQWDIEKTYSKFGTLVYESKKGTDDYSDVIALAMGEIDALNEKINELEGRLRSHKRAKKCEGCGKDNELDSSFCSRCGGALEEDGDGPFVVDVHGDDGI